ncbi:MAG: hypothetical protein EBT45_07660, partial [Alphaproteobacteria bacterium]|nr:hypothetical protein [Alphaproteobacteria bacterium]
MATSNVNIQVSSSALHFASEGSLVPLHQRSKSSMKEFTKFAFENIKIERGDGGALTNKKIEQLDIHTTNLKSALIVMQAAAKHLHNKTDQEFDSFKEKFMDARIVFSEPDEKGDYKVSFYKINANGQGSYKSLEMSLSKKEHDQIETIAKANETEASDLFNSNFSTPNTASLTLSRAANQNQLFKVGGEHFEALKEYAQSGSEQSDEKKEKAIEAIKQYQTVFGEDFSSSFESAFPSPQELLDKLLEEARKVR